jgi:hypothetical protein
MTKAQRNWFERIAIGDSKAAMAQRTTIRILLAKGLVKRGEDRITIGDPRLPVIRIKQYHVPLWAHIQWRQWASEQPGGEEDR